MPNKCQYCPQMASTTVFVQDETESYDVDVCIECAELCKQQLDEESFEEITAQTNEIRNQIYQ